MWNFSEDKKMKRQILISMSALCMLAACTPAQKPEIQEPTENVIHFTATLAPKGENPLSKAITTGTEGGKEVLNVAWAEGEEIAVYYQTSGDPATATATVQSVTNGVATITADLTGAINGGSVSLVYPATLHNGTGGIDDSQLMNNQNGLLRSGNKNISNISKDFDAATATGTITVSGSEATISGTVAMQNRVCILKITLGFSNDGTSVISNLSAGTTLTIAVGDGHGYTISSPFEDEAQPVGAPTVYRPFRSGDVIYVALLPFTSQSLLFSSTSSGGTSFSKLTIGTLSAGKFYRNVPVTLKHSTNIITLTSETGAVTLNDGDVLTGTGGSSTHVTIADGANVILLDAIIPGIMEYTVTTQWAGLTCEGDANIILAGTNSVQGYYPEYPGILIPKGKTLFINGSGSLTAVSGNFGGGIGSAAGIGGGNRIDCGRIIINGGSITATGGIGAAGIGCGHGDLEVSPSCDGITINGGTVVAMGGKDAAGIGVGNLGICGSITIASTVTSVTTTKGEDAPYSIGKGTYSSECGTITIGGTVYYDGAAFQNGGETFLATSPLVYQP